MNDRHLSITGSRSLYLWAMSDRPIHQSAAIIQQKVALVLSTLGSLYDISACGQEMGRILIPNVPMRRL